MRWVLLITTCVLVCSCSTLRTTNTKTAFTDYDGTHYERQIVLPAGVQLEGQDAMSYRWDGEGGGEISIGQSGRADTIRQAEMLELQNQAMLNFASELINLVAPLVGMNMQLDAEDEARDDANRQALRQMWSEIARDEIVPLITQGQQRTETNIREEILPRVDTNADRINELIESVLEIERRNNE